MNKLVVVLGTVFIVLNLVLYTQNPKNNFIDPYEQVLEVIDGDTFVLDHGKARVRLFGIDTPDLKNCYGQESFSRLKELLKEGKVQLKEPVGDRFGRVVALVYVDGVLINDILLKEGLASFDTQQSSAKDRMKQSNDHAKANKIGIYSDVCTQPTPPDPNCLIKGNYDMDKKQNLYFTPDCPHYNYVVVKKYEGDRWFCSVKEAIANGFSQSPDCSLRKYKTN